MKTTTRILSIALVVGVVGSAFAQDPHVVYDKERGELSPGTQMPTRQQLLNSIRSGTPTALMGMLEYGERLECYECVPLLVERILESNDPRVREFSAWWLRRRLFAVGRVLTHMRNVLANDADPVRRGRAAEALGELLVPGALEPLADAVQNDEAAVVRASAVRALGRLNHPAGAGAIADAMADPEVEVRRAALGTVLRVNFFREQEALVDGLGDPDTAVRKQSARLVGELEVVEAVPALVALLEGDEDRDVRQAAAWALGRIGGGEAREALLEAQQSETESLVRDAVRVALAM
ncbi:MAG: HEAT repeat domain-containing protein [Myxococcota bacterium]